MSQKRKKIRRINGSVAKEKNMKNGIKGKLEEKMENCSMEGKSKQRKKRNSSKKRT